MLTVWRLWRAVKLPPDAGAGITSLVLMVVVFRAVPSTFAVLEVATAHT